MSEITLHMLRLFVDERLSAASEEIFRIIEKTISEQHAEVSRLNKEIDYHRKLLDTVLKPEIKLYRTDHQKLSSVVVTEEVVLPVPQLCEPERSSALVKVESEPRQIKEEQEELWTSQREEHQGPEADAEESSSAQTCVQTQHNEDQTQFSDLTRSVESNEGDCLSPIKTKQTRKEPDVRERVQRRATRRTTKDVWPVSAAQPEKTGRLDGRKRGEPQSGLRIHKTPERRAVKKQCSCGSPNPKPHSQSHAARFSCKVCGRRFLSSGSLMRHVQFHTKGRKCRLVVCSESFMEGSEGRTHASAGLNSHMRTHVREKPYCCHVCGKDFRTCGNLNKHMIIHTGEKPYSCQVCGKRVSSSTNLAKHMKTHSKAEHY